MIYLLDTNAVSDIMGEQLPGSEQAAEHANEGQTLGICQPVYYELYRGLLWRNSPAKLRILNEIVLPTLEWFELTNADWKQAARFWADARRSGKQLGDPDLLLAALAYRLNAVIVSADSDFDALSVRRENWRE